MYRDLPLFWRWIFCPRRHSRQLSVKEVYSPDEGSGCGWGLSVLPFPMFLTYGILYRVPISPWHLEAPSMFRFTDSQLKKNFRINYNMSPTCIRVICCLEDMLDFGVDSGTSADICEWVDRIYFACKADIHLRDLKREALDWMSLSCSHFCVSTNIMVLRGRALGRWLAQKVSALLMIDVY